MICAAACASCSMLAAGHKDTPAGRVIGIERSVVLLVALVCKCAESSAVSSGQLRAYTAGSASSRQSSVICSTGCRSLHAERNATSSASGCSAAHQNNGALACSAKRCSAAWRTTPGSRASRSTCHNCHTICASSDSRPVLRVDSCASAARQRSSTEAGCASANGSNALVSSSAIPIKVCASGSRSVLRRAANNFFNHGVCRSDAYSASKRSTLLAGCAPVSSGRYK